MTEATQQEIDMSEVDPFDEYDDEDVVDLDPANKAPSNKLDRFKGEAGKTYRVALLYFHTLESSIVRAAKRAAKKEGKDPDKDQVKDLINKSLAKRAEELEKSVDELETWQKLDLRKAQFKKVITQYGKFQGGGLFESRLGKDGPEADKIWSKLEEPTTYYYTIVLIYPTDPNGNVEKEAILRSSLVKPWRFAGGVFNRLIEVNQSLSQVGDGLSLANQDLRLKCKNAQYQNFEIDFAGKALWTQSDKIKNKFLPMAVDMYEKMTTSDARRVSTADLKEKLGLGGDSGEDVADDSEMDDILSSV